MRRNPAGWDEDRVRSVLEYNGQRIGGDRSLKTGGGPVLRDCYEDGNAVTPTDWTDGGDLVSPRAGMDDGWFLAS